MCDAMSDALNQQAPFGRLRRLRRTEGLRRLVREHVLSVDDLIYPLFVTHGQGVKEPVASMPGVYRYSVDRLAEELEEIASLRIPAVMLFGVPAHKDPKGSGAYDDEGEVQQAIRLIKRDYPQLVVMADNCLCEYTDHGHCGVVRGTEIENDASLELLARTAVSQAAAGADVIAPSNMMDGFVWAIRRALDEHGFQHVPILSYAVKYASAFYGPFRDAAGSAPQFGDRRSYQMDPPNLREAVREAAEDVAQGADMLMVKPGLPYLDVVRVIRDTFDLPLAVYNVSGEYAMVKAAARNGWIDEERTVLELLTGMKRAGADMILTYHAKDAARWLAGG
jgi:porphobilinogen synthase